MTSPHEQALAAETPMADHVANFWHLLETETVRILVNIRRESSSMGIYWDGASFPDDVAKALVADRRPASLPADVDGLMLKPLEWKQTNDAIGEEAFVASTPVGEYLATEAGLYFHVSDATSGDLLLATNGTSEAKTAAQADYSRRILSAIDTSALSAKLAAVERERDEARRQLVAAWNAFGPSKNRSDPPAFDADDLDDLPMWTGGDLAEQIRLIEDDAEAADAKVKALTERLAEMEAER